MHTVVRVYSGNGAAETIDLVIASKKDIKKLMRSVKGFVEYSAIRTEDGGFTITVSKNSKTSDAITAIASEWVLAHAHWALSCRNRVAFHCVASDRASA